MICKKTASCAERRNLKRKFFKPYRGFAESFAQIKSHCITITYVWRRECDWDPNRALKTLPNSIQEIGMPTGLAEEPSNAFATEGNSQPFVRPASYRTNGLFDTRRHEHWL